jgi:hypothetical protein
MKLSAYNGSLPIGELVTGVASHATDNPPDPRHPRVDIFGLICGMSGDETFYECGASPLA